MKALKIVPIFPNKQYVKYIGEVTSPAIFAESGRTIDPEGLYSQEIFGIIGSDDRMVKYGYIDLYAEVLHPRIYHYLITISSLFKGIIEGTTFAKYDAETNTFVKADITDGDTGITFFMEHLNTLDFGTSNSADRQNMINSLNKWREEGHLTNDKLLVIPAGLRDFETDDNGRIIEIDINDLYRKVLNIAKMLRGIKSLKSVDYIRSRVQTSVYEVYLHISSMLDGKKKFIGKHWTSRNVEFATRNVIGGKPIEFDHLDDIPDDIVDYASIGLLQYIKAIAPVTKHYLTKYYVESFFSDGSNKGYLFDVKTKKKIHVDVPDKERSYWTTSDGLENIMNRMINTHIRNTPVLISGKAIAMVYDQGNHIEIYTDDTYYGEGIDMKALRPITYGEMFYTAVFPTVGRYPAFMTRYPITEPSSMVPVKTELNTTVTSRRVDVTLYGLTGYTHSVPHYPVIGKEWDESLAPNYTRLSGHSADMDGDKMSYVAVLEEESIEETNRLFDTISLYIKTDGSPVLDTNDHIIKTTALSMSRQN